MKTSLKALATLAAGLVTALAAATFSTSAAAAPGHRDHARDLQVQRYQHAERVSHFGRASRFSHRHARHHHRHAPRRFEHRGWYR